MTARPTRLNPRVTNVDLTASSPPRSRPTVRNRAKLARFETALATKANPVITVLGNSISWGVGSDGSGSTTSGFYEPYRQYAWPVLLRKLFAARAGLQPCENFIALSTLFDYVSNPTNGAVTYQTVGPFGSMGGGGGLSLPTNSATIDIAAARTGVFTELDVILFGTVAGTTGIIPRVLIDDVEVLAGGGTSATNLTVVSITGLSEASHKITLQGAGGGFGTFVAGVVTRRGSGVIVNRIAVPGAKASDAIGAGAGFNSTQQNREIDAATLAGYSDLVIIQFTANEIYQQVSLASFQSDLNAIIGRVTAAGGCVLLLGDPQVTNEDTAYTIKGSQYRAVLQTISDGNQYVAYADHAAIFGDRANGEAMGMWPSGTVHPALEGHRRMADFVFRDVLPSPTIGATGSGISREVFSTDEKRKLGAAATTATPSVLAQRDSNANLTADAFVPSMQPISASGTTTLTADAPQVIKLTGTSSQTLVLPTTSVVGGRSFQVINNNGTNTAVIQSSDATQIAALPVGQSMVFTALQDTPTGSAHWSIAAGQNKDFRFTAVSGTAVLRDGNGNVYADNFIATKTPTTTSAGTLTLAIDSAQVQELTGSTTHTVKLPTTSITAGMEYRIINNSSGTVTVQSSGANTIDTVAAGFTKLFMAQVDTPTTAANWRVFTPSA